MSTLLHWAEFGQRGEPSTRRATAENWGTKSILKPVTATWDQAISPQDVPKLLNGFVPRDMDDKWFIYAEGPDGQGQASLHLHRSWTGYKMAEVKLTIELDKHGKFAERDAHFTEVTWETDDDRYKGGQTDGGAKSMVVDVCNWVLGAQLISTQEVENEQDES